MKYIYLTFSSHHYTIVELLFKIDNKYFEKKKKYMFISLKSITVITLIIKTIDILIQHIIYII